MILLDTDHMTVLGYPENARHVALMEKLDATLDRNVGLPIVAVEEQMRGWLAKIHGLRTFHLQVPVYAALARFLTFLRGWKIVEVDFRAAKEFDRLRKQKTRIGTQDLKIASIALVNDALLLSANLRDFRKVPALRVENWLA